MDVHVSDDPDHELMETLLALRAALYAHPDRLAGIVGELTGVERQLLLIGSAREALGEDASVDEVLARLDRIERRLGLWDGTENQ